MPLFRMQGAIVPNPSAKGRHFYDLEGVFGSNYSPIDKTLQTLFEAPLENGTTNKLTGTEFKCQQTVSFLNSIKAACDQPQPPSDSLINNDAAQPTPPPTSGPPDGCALDRKSTRLNSSHQIISYAVFCFKKKNTPNILI